MPHRVCPWWGGYLLLCPLRRWLHNPSAILAPWVSPGMIALEPGPGMGHFTLELARRVGPVGRVVAVDLQPQMIRALMRRAKRAAVAERIDARLPKGVHLGIEEYAGRVDFALAFAVVHEVQDQAALFADISQAMKVGGKLLLVEPTGHVPSEEFQASLERARAAGFAIESWPTIQLSRAVVLRRTRPSG